MGSKIEKVVTEESEEQYGTTAGQADAPMPPENYGKRMWQLWGPILIKWGIEFLVSMIAMTVLAMVYQVANPDAFTAALNSEQSMIDLYNQLLEQYLKSSTLIQGMTHLSSFQSCGFSSTVTEKGAYDGDRTE